MKKLLLLGMVLCFSTLTIQANTRQEVKLRKCTDGDTAHFMMDGSDTTVRFLAINAPEYTKKKEPYGKEASEYVCDILTNAEKVELEFDDGSDPEDKYGRTLAWVYADGKLVQRELVKQGLAEVKYIYGEYAYTEELRQLEKEAKKQQLKMWSNQEYQEESADTMPYIWTAAGGVLLILIGLFVTKGRNRQKLIRKGMRQLKHK